MDHATKRLIGSGLNLISMIAFTVPGGASIGVAVLIGMTLFEAFTGEEPPKPPGIAVGELQNAIADVSSKIMTSFWLSDVDDMTQEILALNQGFLDVSAAGAKLKLDHERFVFLTNNDTVSHFIAFGDTYFDMTLAQSGILETLRDFRYRLELRAKVGPQAHQLTDDQVRDHQVLTVGLYVLVGSLTVAYLKTAVLWNWGQEMLAAWQYEQYQQDLAQWDQNPADDPKDRYPASITTPTYKPPTWEDWTTDTSKPPPNNKLANCSANLLFDEIQAMLDYCVGSPTSPGYYAKLRQHLDDFEKAASAGETSLPKGSTSASITKSQMVHAAAPGIDAAELQANFTSAYGLDKINGDDIVAFGTALDEWRSAQASVMFHTHKVKNTGETLIDVAAAEYPGLDKQIYAQKLFDCNDALDYDVDVGDPGGIDSILTRRQTVKIFDLKAYPYLPLGKK